MKEKVTPQNDPVSWPPTLGATIRLHWTEMPQMGTINDMSWAAGAIADPKPTGKWWGPWMAWVAAFGKQIASDGEWDYDRSAKSLSLWVPFTVDGLALKHLLMGLHGFDFPPVHGSSGSGRLFPPFRIPTTNPWPFLSWQVP